MSRLKPHPESLALALQTLSLPPEQVLFVGDSINDILAADKTGMAACFLSCGESRVTGLSAALNVHHISHLSIFKKFYNSPTAPLSSDTGNLTSYQVKNHSPSGDKHDQSRLDKQ